VPINSLVFRIVMAVWFFGACFLNNEYFSRVVSKVTAPHKIQKISSAEELQNFTLYSEHHPIFQIFAEFEVNMCFDKDKITHLKNDKILSNICSNMTTIDHRKKEDAENVVPLIKKCNTAAYFANTQKVTRLLAKVKVKSSPHYKKLPFYTGTDNMFQTWEFLYTHGQTGGYLRRKMGRLVASGIVELWRNLKYETKYYRLLQKEELIQEIDEVARVSFNSDFIAIFYMLTLGAVLAFSALTFEFIISKLL